MRAKSTIGCVIGLVFPPDEAGALVEAGEAGLDRSPEGAAKMMLLEV